MPKIESKYPQNIHNLIELLFVDLDIWVNSNIPSPFLSFSLSFSLLSFFLCLSFLCGILTVFVIAGTKEEKKHQVYKRGAKAANPVNTEKQLVTRDVIISTLRYLLHGGGTGPQDRVVMTSEFASFSHPRNPHAPHPLLEMLTAYGANTKFDVYPRKFFYQKGSRVSETFSGPEMEAVSAALNRPVLSSIVLPSKQFVVDGKSFTLDDYVSVVADPQNATQR